VTAQPLVPYPVVVREVTDRHGDVVSTARITLDAAIVAPSSMEEPDRNRATVRDTRTMYVPHGTQILASDVIELPGEPGRWHAVGPVVDWTHPMTGWAPGGEVRLERVTG
jgi:hypothetical protein